MRSGWCNKVGKFTGWLIALVTLTAFAAEDFREITSVEGISEYR